MTLYRYIPIWRRITEGATLYRCFEVLGRGFTVQSRDFFRLNEVRDKEIVQQHEIQFLELLIEEAPEIRSGLQPTIEQAIEAFDASFEESR